MAATLPPTVPKVSRNTRMWLMKSEPETYGWEDLCREGEGTWDGVRNHLAKLHLQAMKVGDLALMYHSVTQKAVVGLMTLTSAAFADPGAEPNQPWVAVKVKPLQKFSRPVTLAEMKAEPRLSTLMLLTHTRLSVMPVNRKHFDIILEQSQRPYSLHDPRTTKPT